jgi:hypothetical protein
LLYLLCAICAAKINSLARRHGANAVAPQHSAIRLQALPRRVDGEADAQAAAPRNPFNDPQNPFEDPQNVVTPSTIQTDVSAPTHPARDDAATIATKPDTTVKDEDMKTSSAVVEETAITPNPFDDREAVPPLPAPSTATPFSPALSTQHSSSISIDTVVVEGWELRSGPVDELSVIAEEDSKEERGAEGET